jgi:glutamine amidotransferase
MIGIIDYGMGNLKSAANGLKEAGAEAVISDQADVLAECERLFLPGVGAFPDAMKAIHEKNLYEPVRKMVSEGKPLIGICLGMQMLYESSDENGETEGFGFLKGRITRMQGHIRIPEIGWNLLEKKQEHPLFAIMSSRPFVYYVHSYYAVDTDPAEVYGTSQYGPVCVPGLVGRDNVIGCQFHPEKSGEDGLKLLKWFNEVKL